jgi:RimJ/RimL family protein N-acetyltransferase
MPTIFPQDGPVPDTGFTTITTGRLVLRRFRPADLAAFIAYRNDPDVARYQGWAVPYPLERAQRRLVEMVEEHPDTPGEWFQFAVALAGTDELIGDCGVHIPDDDPRQAEIGFTFAVAWQGKGYATEAVRRLLDYLFDACGKHRVVAACDARNVRSAALLRRVGMRREGLLRQAVWAKGEWTDEELYAVLREEWAPGQRVVDMITPRTT